MDEKDLKEEDLLKEINEGIGRQIADELGDGSMEEPGEEMPKEPGKKSWFKKRYIAFGIGGVVLVVILSAALIINGMLDKIKKENAHDVEFAQTDLDDDEYNQYRQSLVNATEKPYIKAEEDVINILLIGEEAIGDNGRGRSDSMMIASINQVEKTLSLTSLMRDIYVKIPGYKNNKLNAAYNFGGGVLLTQTVEENFGIQIDGYVRVNFDSFETIVDMLGGVNIELGEIEAKYLRTTNYISKKQYRTVQPGMNLLNGNQALGYCRVRKVPAVNGENNDYGRTYRQRAVLMAIFEKYKSKNPAEMISIANTLLGYITTNLSKNQMVTYITTAATQGTMNLRNLRVPADHTFDTEYRLCGGVSGDVLTIDFEENIRLIREFIYGEKLIGELGAVPTGNYGIGMHGTEGKVYSAPKITNPPVYATKEPVATPKPTPVPEQSTEPTAEPTVDPEAVPGTEPTVSPGEGEMIDPPEEEVPGTEMPLATPTPAPPTSTPAGTATPLPPTPTPLPTPPAQSSDDGSMPEEAATPIPEEQSAGNAKVEGTLAPDEGEEADDGEGVPEETPFPEEAA